MVQYSLPASTPLQVYSANPAMVRPHAHTYTYTHTLATAQCDSHSGVFVAQCKRDVQEGCAILDKSISIPYRLQVKGAVIRDELTFSEVALII